MAIGLSVKGLNVNKLPWGDFREEPVSVWDSAYF